ncbi:TetR family transcriptional regulator [Nocardioides sp. Root190]|uniref:TetR/AcrR family transcriptional regulator n=1 Tax=Nocardioides sp. Root190 TaxID=1736488 RepID=UPI0006F3F574|nr:TetR/AcrR family transcriptional regulator [Nocardioides sp. Root190]KRB80410.1 TetR family transcriptional regulator [Nocardioides sp. Root190]
MAKKSGSPTVAAESEGKPLDKKSARTRVRILDAAAQVLSAKGYAGMRLSDVAEVAELQAPAIYYYFPSRDDLIEEVMWVGLADMREFLTKALEVAPADAGAMERILIAVETHLRHELEISDYTTAAIRNAGQLPDNIRDRHDAEEKKYGALWRDLFKAAAETGELREDLDPYLAQMLVMGTINWTAEWWQPNRATIDRVVANAQSYVRAALSPAS